MKPETRMRYRLVPHLNPLPKGEGTATRHLRITSRVQASESTTTRLNDRTLNPMTLKSARTIRQLFPLPRGEGKGEGQTSLGIRVGFEPTGALIKPPRTHKPESADQFITGSLSTRSPEAGEKLTRARRRVAQFAFCNFHFRFCNFRSLNSQPSTLN